ncbi:MAG: hypothetical protein WCV88_04345 [Patescibacteria group bacterium]|jgi:hypothetical protein
MPAKKRLVKKTKPKIAAKPKIKPKPTKAKVVPPPEITAPLITVKAEPSRLKLWVSVSLAMAIIVCIWAYSLSTSLFSSNAVQDSIAATRIDDFMNSISGDFSNLQDNTGKISNQLDEVKTQIDTNQPNNTTLDNLFSDLQ